MYNTMHNHSYNQYAYKQSIVYCPVSVLTMVVYPHPGIDKKK